MQLVVDSRLTSYSRVGKGKTIVLLHGWGDSSAGLKQLQTELAKEYDVVALDLPGFGGTVAPEHAWGLDDYAKFVINFVSKLKLNLNTLVGHSNGGAIALRSLSLGLDPKNLVLISSSGIRGEYKGRNRLLRVITKIGKLLTLPLPASIKKKLRKKVYTTIGSDMLVAEDLQDTFKKIVTDDTREDAAKVNIPTLIIYGDKDVSTPLSYGQTFNNLINGSKLDVIAGGEHFIPQKNASDIANMIKGFIK